ncbi:prolyl oligopeptidase family serine peptidase [Streptomyces sp. H10-C2]|uniref:S9 family peptidase n=1 Tax=unclassified Streptomyces TaxID=2593676 RepID=UPI0024B8E58E|nr:MULTISPECIES: prolyl oligopeptidase family serine peptidase [unclassified Streptomyces]MDJ0343823.1 prolyl oligopeptidase family serine peptidase [Streptomyces sp. PH10-H1]MDJ0373412.1 prolyl oligopeptidase family serine peptidase [Streptomyces sp. H10-C2]
MTEELSFPRQHARTQRFTLGAPRSFTVSPDGERVAFLRSRSGTDPSNLLWILDPASGQERIAADPGALLSGAGEELSAQERARRERSREGSAGVVGYAVDQAVELAAFALSGRLFVAELRAGTARELPAAGPVVDPRPSPDGRRVAYVAGGALRVVDAEGGGDRALAEPDGDEVTWGLAEFIAQEEMARSRGFWWSPDSERLLVARVDEAPVQRWWIADPAHPDRRPAEIAYPAAGTPNAEVTLALIGLDGSRVDVEWDRERYPYLAQVHWSAAGPPVLLVQARDQRSQLFLSLDTGSGRTQPVHAEEDQEWLDLFAGVPAWTPDGKLVRIADEAGARVLVVGDRPLTGPQLHVRAVLDITADDVLVSASAGATADAAETGEIHVYRVSERGVSRVSDEPGVHSAVRSGALTVLASATPDTAGARVRVLRDDKQVAVITSYAQQPVLRANVRLTEAGERRIPAAVLLPTGYREGDGPLPVLMDPYGGPHGQRVVAAHNAHLASQWFADQGFAVIVADGRGTPGRSPAWEKAIVDDFAGVTLDDQVEALHALAGSYPLDLSRVGIRGWSYGGYLAALAVLRRPDVFHAGVVGAPVTDLRLYDTHYTERYLGRPDERPEVYAANSVVTDEGLSGAVDQVRPMMIIHGLADDNVLVAHSLRLSSALLAAGRPHEVLPLSGVTHMTPQEEVAENLLLLQVAFLKRTLGIA